MQKKGGAGAIVSLVLGIVGLVAWFIPFLGLPITLLGLVLGIRSRNSSRVKIATLGTAICAIGLLASAVNAFLGAVLHI